jgi:putative oxidoreductase
VLSLNIGIAILRLALGFVFIGHGAQKLFGWFGGSGFSGTTQMMEHLNLHPAQFWALVAGSAEFFGGLFLALGLLTPLAAAVIIGVMLMAILKVHLKNGVWNSNRGFEYPLMNALLSAFLGLFGPGAAALDTTLGFNYPTMEVFVIALAVVVVGVLGGLLLGSLSQTEVHNN